MQESKIEVESPKIESAITAMRKVLADLYAWQCANLAPDQDDPVIENATILINQALISMASAQDDHAISAVIMYSMQADLEANNIY